MHGLACKADQDEHRDEAQAGEGRARDRLSEPAFKAILVEGRKVRRVEEYLIGPQLVHDAPPPAPASFMKNPAVPVS